MKYNEQYKSIFAGCRVLLDDELVNANRFLHYKKEHGHMSTCNYIVMVANWLTAYNELSYVNFFVKMKHFYQ